MAVDFNEAPIENQSTVELKIAVVDEVEKHNDSLVVAAAEKIILETIPLIIDKEIVAPSLDKRDFFIIDTVLVYR